MPRPHHPLVSKEWAEKLEPYFEQLKPRQEQMIRMRFGLGYPPHTYSQLAKTWGISHERCRQIIHRSIFRLYSIYRKEAEA